MYLPLLLTLVSLLLMHQLPGAAGCQSRQRSPCEMSMDSGHTRPCARSEGGGGKPGYRWWYKKAIPHPQRPFMYLSKPQCHRFHFAGCGEKVANRFRTKRECLRRCKPQKDPNDFTDVTQPTLT